MSKLKKRLIIFDLDGTLLNTLEDLAVSVNHGLESCGFPTHPISNYSLMIGNGIRTLINNALPEADRTEENKDRVLSHFLKHYQLNMSVHTHVYPGVAELIRQLTNKQYLLAIASNKYHAATERLIARYFPNTPFIAVFGQRDNVPRKPNPQIVNEIMTIAQASPQETLFVGDSGVDMNTAFNAQVTGVGVTWGFRDEEELIEEGANHIIRNPMELLAIME